MLKGRLAIVVLVPILVDRRWPRARCHLLLQRLENACQLILVRNVLPLTRLELVNVALELVDLCLLEVI